MTRTQKILSTAALAAASTGTSAQAAQAGDAEPETEESVAAHLKQLDARLFEAAFETCDMELVAGLLADDLEFYHDRDGLSYTTADAFISDLRRDCASGSAGGKRVLVEGSLTTHMIGNFGAMQHGRHEFHEVMSDGSSIAREKGVFMHMWKRDKNGPAGWKISRIISYDHEGIE